MRLKHFLSVFLTLLTLSVGQMWGLTKEEEWTLTSTSSNFTQSNCTTYFSQPYGMKKANAYIQAQNIQNFKDYASLATGIEISVKCLQNGGTGSKLTVYLLDKDGNSLGSQEITPVNANAANSTTYQKATFSSNLSGATGFKVQCSTFDKNILINGAKYVLTYNNASYTVNWTINPAAGGSLSATSGTSTTVTPNAAYIYGSPAYTVTSGTATVSQSTNTFTATPTANCSIRINMVEKTKYTLNYHDGNGDDTKMNVYEGTNLISALGTPAASCDATSTTFVGWTTTEIASKTDTKPTFVAADAVVNSTTAAAKYYAVYAKFNGGTISISGSDLISGLNSNGSYSNGSFTKQISSTNYTFNTYGSKQNTQIQMRASDAYIQIPTLPQKITNISCTACNNAGTSSYTGILRLKSAFAAGSSITNDLDTKELSDVTSFSWDISADASAGYLVTSAGLRLSNVSITYGVYKDYMTTCCTELGQINGSFFWTTHFCPVWPEKHRS